MKVLDKSANKSIESTAVEIKSKDQRDNENCVKDFGLMGFASIPVLLNEIQEHIIDKFSFDKHWSDQIVDALADGYSTATEIRQLLERKDNSKEYTLREMSLIFHWYFRTVSACDGEHTFEYRMRHNPRTAGKLS